MILLFSFCFHKPKKHKTGKSPFAIFIFLYKLEMKTIFNFPLISTYQTNFLLLEKKKNCNWN